ncbi:hypothetical protein V6Z11_A06G112300 [Gossypium hirsutum]
MESIVVRFWWQKSHGKRGMHWCEWGKPCKLKEDGGLGFRSLAKFNVAILAKQGWRLISNPDSLMGRVLKAKYYPNSDFLNSSLKAGASYTWRSIRAAKKILQDGLCWRVGTSNNIYILYNAWIPSSVNYKISYPVLNCNMELVAELINSANREWRSEIIIDVFDAVDDARIL